MKSTFETGERLLPIPCDAPRACQGAVRIFGQLPDGFLAFAIPDRSCEPLIRRGEVAVVDPEDREVVDGALFLMRYVGGAGGQGRASLRVLEGFARPVENFSGVICRPPAFYFVAHNRARPGRPGPFAPADGPYHIGPTHDDLTIPSVVGRVVGIFAAHDSSKLPFPAAE
ncbi:MAG: hypothetical protein RLZZ444_1093 [Pseudomonadota bacterium]